MTVLWSRFWDERRWGPLLAAAHDDVNDRFPEARCLWYCKVRKAPLDDLRGIILDQVERKEKQKKERRGEDDKERSREREREREGKRNNLVSL